MNSSILIIISCLLSYPFFTSASRSCIIRTSPANWRPLSLKLKTLGLSLIPLSPSGYYEVRDTPDPALHEDDPAVLSDEDPRWMRRLGYLPEVEELLPNHEKVMSLRQLPSYTDPEWNNGNMYYWQGRRGAKNIGLINVWNTGVQGNRVRIAVIDDGVDILHNDLLKNNKQNSWDYIRGGNGNVRPAYGFRHGTLVAGVALATRDNAICGFGAAPEAELVVVRILSSSGSSSPARETDMFTGNGRHIETDLFVISWGVNDNGATVDGPQPQVVAQQRIAATNGRGGLGSIMVVAAGNGGLNDDDCICDGYVSNRFVIPVQAALANSSKPYFTEHCAAAITTTIVGYNGLVSTQPTNLIGQQNCTTSFSGTSAAAPLLAGIIALALENNPGLTRRDVTQLVIESSEPSLAEPATNRVTNGAPNTLEFSPHFGFGILNADKFVQRANNTMPRFTRDEASFTVVANNVVNPEFIINSQDTNIESVEWIELEVSLTASVRGQVQVKLISPSGTVIVLLALRPQDTGSGTFNAWRFFSSPAFWGESPFGIWKPVVNTQTTVTGMTLVLNVHGKIPIQGNTPAPASDDPGWRPDTAEIVGIVVGVVFVPGIIVLIIVYAVVRRRKNHRKKRNSVAASKETPPNGGEMAEQPRRQPSWTRGMPTVHEPDKLPMATPVPASAEYDNAGVSRPPTSTHI